MMKSKTQVGGFPHEMIPRGTRLAILLLSATSLSMGCKPSPDVAPDVDPQRMTQAESESNAAQVSEKDVVSVSKAEFMAAMREELTRINADLDQISERIDRAGGTAGAAARSGLDKLRKQAALLMKRLDTAEETPPAGWDDMKNEIQDVCDNLMAGLLQMGKASGENVAR